MRRNRGSRSTRWDTGGQQNVRQNRNPPNLGKGLLGEGPAMPPPSMQAPAMAPPPLPPLVGRGPHEGGGGSFGGGGKGAGLLGSAPPPLSSDMGLGGGNYGDRGDGSGRGGGAMGSQGFGGLNQQSFSRGINQDMDQDMGRTYGMDQDLGRTRGLSQDMGRTQVLGHDMGRLGQDMGRTHSLGQDLGRTHGLGQDIGRSHGLGQDMGPTLGMSQDIGRTHGISQDMGRLHGLGQDMGRTLGYGQDIGGTRGLSPDMGRTQSGIGGMNQSDLGLLQSSLGNLNHEDLGRVQPSLGTLNQMGGAGYQSNFGQQQNLNNPLPAVQSGMQNTGLLNQPSVRETQLQMVNNLLKMQQQQQPQQAPLRIPPQGNPSSMPGLLGSAPPMGKHGMKPGGDIPSLFDLKTRKFGGSGPSFSPGSKRPGGYNYNNRGPSDNKRMRRAYSPVNRRSSSYERRDNRSDQRRPRSRDSSRRSRTPDSYKRDRRDSENRRVEVEVITGPNVDRRDPSPPRQQFEYTKADTGGEEYDPAEPTEDDEDREYREEEQKRENDYNQEIVEDSKYDREDDDYSYNQAEEDTEESRSEEYRTPRESPRSREKSDSNLTITVDRKKRFVSDGDKGSNAAGGKLGHFCHACSLECRTIQHFANHMKSRRHMERMQFLADQHQKQSNQLFDRVKAEFHLRKIESNRVEGRDDRDEGEDHSRGNWRDRRSSYEQRRISDEFHRRSEDRSRGRDREKWPTCNICKQTFKSPRKFVNHCKTPHHIENRARRYRKDDGKSDEEDFPDDIGDLVTLDTIGFEDDLLSEDEEKESKTEGESGEGQKSDTPRAVSPEVPSQYDPDKPIGQRYIIPVSGFFCKLCHKFYNNETAAKLTHCQSAGHFEKYQKIMMTKLMHKRLKEEAAKEQAAKSEQSDSNKQSGDKEGNIQQKSEVKKEVDTADSSQNENHPEVNVTVTFHSGEQEESGMRNGNNGSEEEQMERSDEEVEETEVVVVKPEKKSPATPRGRGRGARRGKGKRV